MKFFKSLIFIALFAFAQSLLAQKIGVVDVQKVFDGYQKVKDARERLDKSKQVAMEELEIYRDEMEKIVNELKEMEEKLKNPNIDTSTLKQKYQEKVKVFKDKQADMVAYDKRAKATISTKTTKYNGRTPGRYQSCHKKSFCGKRSGLSTQFF